jgi:integrase/recombinase XerD
MVKALIISKVITKKDLAFLHSKGNNIMGRPANIIHPITVIEFIEAKASFRHYLETMGRNAKSVYVRLRLLNEFFAWIESQGIQSLELIKYAHLTAYECHLRQRPNKVQVGLLSDKSVSHHLWIISQLFGYLQLVGKISHNPCSKLEIKFPKDTGQRTILSQAEIKEIYQVANEFDRTWFGLCYGCGLRVMELRDLDINDIQLSDGVVVVRHGKGNKKRLVPMTLKIMDDLRAYLKKRKKTITEPPTQALFLHIRGGRMKDYTFNKWLKQLIMRTENEVLKARVNQIGIHCLRHSIATHLIENGVKMEQVKEFLGHSHLETTEIYTRVSQEQINKLSQ